jgi:hypothetical protein
VTDIQNRITDAVFNMESRDGYGWVRLDPDLAEDGTVTSVSTKTGSSAEARADSPLAPDDSRRGGRGQRG